MINVEKLKNNEIFYKNKNPFTFAKILQKTSARLPSTITILDINYC